MITNRQNLRLVFDRIKNANLKLNPDKCELFKTRVQFLGHIVSKEGITTDPEKVQSVQDWPIPSNIKEIRSFLGLCSYYRRLLEIFPT